MPKKSDAYTIFILPDPTSKPYSFSIRKKTCRIIGGVLFVALVAVFGLVIQSFSLVEDLSEVASLREENKTQRTQIRSAFDSVSDLKQQMARLLELDEKLRVMTDLSPKKKSVRDLAQGGTEEQVDTATIEESDIVMLEELSESHPVQVRKEVTEKVILGLTQDLVHLQKQVVEETESFKELIQAISEIQMRWARTPSIWPVRGWVTSSFGLRTSPFTGKLVMHNGLDISAHRGTPVVATADGTVQRAHFDNDLGRGIFIRHDYGKVTIYGHMDKMVVLKNQTVSRGDVIGYVGSTGKSTGPHLHYEVRINNVPVDPTRYILN